MVLFHPDDEVPWATIKAVNSPCAPAAGCNETATDRRDFAKDLLHFVQHFQDALDRIFGLIGMQIDQARHVGDTFVALRVTSSYTTDG